MASMNVAEKITLIRLISKEVMADPDHKFRKLKDLLLFCSDPKDIDVVIKAMTHLSEVFCDILPAYRIREHNDVSQ